MEDRAHRLIDRIYAAALDSDVWQQVAEGISEIFGDSPVMLGFVNPGERWARATWWRRRAYRSSHVEHMFKDVPWSRGACTSSRTAGATWAR